MHHGGRMIRSRVIKVLKLWFCRQREIWDGQAGEPLPSSGCERPNPRIYRHQRALSQGRWKVHVSDESENSKNSPKRKDLMVQNEHISKRFLKGGKMLSNRVFYRLLSYRNGGWFAPLPGSWRPFLCKGIRSVECEFLEPWAQPRWPGWKKRWWVWDPGEGRLSNQDFLGLQGDLDAFVTSHSTWCCLIPPRLYQGRVWHRGLYTDLQIYIEIQGGPMDVNPK